MKTRHLGRSGLQVSALGLGCMVASTSHGLGASSQEETTLLRVAVEKGVSFFDTAEVYGPYTNEAMVEACTIRRSRRFAGRW